MATVQVHNPTAAEPQSQEIATQMRGLRESRVGILENGKQHAELVLSAIVDDLSRQYGVIKSVVGHKTAAAPAAPEVIDELAEHSDWVFVGSAD